MRASAVSREWRERSKGSLQASGLFQPAKLRSVVLSHKEEERSISSLSRTHSFAIAQGMMIMMTLIQRKMKEEQNNVLHLHLHLHRAARRPACGPSVPLPFLTHRRVLNFKLRMRVYTRMPVYGSSGVPPPHPHAAHAFA